MIAFEQDSRVLLTEIDLWLYVPVATNCCLEVQSLVMQGLENMLFWVFFLKLTTEICLHPDVADEHLL